MKLNKWRRVDRRSISYRHVLNRICVFPRPLYVVLRDTTQAVHVHCILLSKQRYVHTMVLGDREVAPTMLYMFLSFAVVSLFVDCTN